MTSLSDKDVLAGTQRVPAENGKGFHLQYTFPDGSEFKTSDVLVPEQLKGGVLISWCTAVRETWDAKQNDKQEEMIARKRRRKKEEAAAPQPPQQAPAPTAPPSPQRVAADQDVVDREYAEAEEDDAIAYVLRKRDAARARANTLGDQYFALGTRLAAAERDLVRWEKIVTALQSEE